jgi:hypothetical protein
MATLRGGRSHKVVIYVPTTTYGDQPVDMATAGTILESVVGFLSQRFGGSTAIRAQGTWLSPTGRLVSEDVTLVYSFTASLSIEDIEAILDFCRHLREMLSQESIAVEIDGTLYLDY